MTNEINIEINADNSTAKAVLAETDALGAALAKKPVTIPVKAQLAFDQVNGAGALTAEIEKGPPVKVPVVANNPINEAFLAEVRSSVKSISADALQIPVDADMLPFQEQLQAVLAELTTLNRADIPVEVGDAMEFRAQVATLVAQVESSTKAVIDIEVNEAGLSELQAKTLAASQSTVGLVGAQQKLDAALASGDDEAVAKARQELSAASVQATEATDALAAAQASAAAAAEGVAEAEDVAAASSRGLWGAMGPLFLVMNVLQLAMFAFGGSSSDTSQKAQDASQSIIALGQSAGTTTQGLVGGNQAIQAMAGTLSTAGTSATAFAQAFSGSVGNASSYTTSLEQQMKQLGSTLADTGGQMSAFDGRSIADIAKLFQGDVLGATGDISKLPDGLRQQVQQYDALAQAVPQAKMALAAMKLEEQQQTQTLAALGFSMSTTSQNANNLGLSISSGAKAFSDATTGLKYLEDSNDKATITAQQGVQQWQQLQASVVAAGQAHQQAADGIVSAEHGVTEAIQGVASAEHGEQQAAEGVAQARHSEQQAILATQQAQQAYTESIYQEQQAQQAVTAARQAAEQQLISLKLQSDDAATSALSARTGLESARESASKFGVNARNAQAVASGPINPGDLAQVQAADALLEAENQVADAQNSSKTAQNALNTARSQGVSDNPQVLSAERALMQAQQGVTQASQGVTNAQYAEQQAVKSVADAQYAQRQAAIQVADAEFGVQQASMAVRQAEQQEAAATVALNTARDNASRSTNANTLAGARNRQQLENLFDAEVALHGPTTTAVNDTEKFGEKMGFSQGQVVAVVKALGGLNGKNVHYSITGTPSIDPSQLSAAADGLGIFSAVARIAGLASGGPGNGLAWVGEYGPEIVRLPSGSEVIPNSNSMGMLSRGEAPLPGFAAGGSVGSLVNPMSALAANFPIAAKNSALDAFGETVHSLGGPPVELPPPAQIDLSSLSFGGGGGGSHVSGNRAANKAIMQQVFSTYGWGSGPAWAAQDYVETREAGYNNLAQNPTSTAYGMAQFLNSTWATVGLQKTSDPRLQSVGMAEYEKQRYGGPIGAAAHERAYNWYGSGGPTSGRVVGVGERGRELVRIPGVGSAPVSSRSSGPLVMEFASNGDSQVGSLVKYLFRTNVIRLQTADGKQVVVK